MAVYLIESPAMMLNYARSWRSGYQLAKECVDCTPAALRSILRSHSVCLQASRAVRTGTLLEGAYREPPFVFQS